MNTIEEVLFKFWLGHTKKMTYEHSFADIHTVIKEFSPDIVPLQFIGINDKNGVKVYNGDIIKFNFWNRAGVAKIVFENGAFGMSEYCEFIEQFWFESFCSYDEPEKDCYPFIEVIGNIYENPELLKIENHEKQA